MTAPTRCTCEEVFARLDTYLDRALAPEEERLVLEHLEICAVCASEYRFETSLLDEVRSKLERIQAPTDLVTRISEALQAAARTHGDRGS